MVSGIVFVNKGGKNDSSAGCWETDSSSTGKTTEWFLSERLFLLSLVPFLQAESRLLVLVPPSLEVLLLSEPPWKGRPVFACPSTAATVCAKDRGRSHVRHAILFTEQTDIAQKILPVPCRNQSRGSHLHYLDTTYLNRINKLKLHVSVQGFL